jgi:hypothetical protein
MGTSDETPLQSSKEVKRANETLLTREHISQEIGIVRIFPLAGVESGSGQPADTETTYSDITTLGEWLHKTTEEYVSTSAQ